MSPFLFNIVLEGLGILFKRAKEKGDINGLSVGNNGPVLTHLQFVDDTMVFCAADKEELLNIKRILRCFELVSGLKINFFKS